MSFVHALGRYSCVAQGPYKSSPSLPVSSGIELRRKQSTRCSLSRKKTLLVWKLDGRIGIACRPGDRVRRCQATVKMRNRNVKVNIFFVFSQFFNCFLCSKPTAQNTTASSRVREQQRLRSARVQAKPDIFPSVLAAAVITSVLYKFESGDMKEIERVELNWYIRTW